MTSPDKLSARVVWQSGVTPVEEIGLAFLKIDTDNGLRSEITKTVVPRLGVNARLDANRGLTIPPIRIRKQLLGAV